MINITIDSQNKEITIRGHANDENNPRCDDSIRACEIVTYATQTLVEGIRTIGGNKPEYSIARGYFHLKTTGLSEASRTAVNLFVLGLKRASKAYARYINVVCDNEHAMF